MWQTRFDLRLKMIGQNIELIRQITGKRKLPRLFMLERTQSLSQVLLMLPDRTHLPVLGLSLAGLIISPVGYLSKLRVGQILEGKLKVAGVDDPVILNLRLIRLFPQSAFFMMESISTAHRLSLEQNVKDRLIFGNLQEMSSQVLHPQFQGGRFWQGPFDTNFIYWQSPTSAVIDRALIEYDGLVLIVDGENYTLKKSVPASDESKGYAGPWLASEQLKVSMGTSWKERLIRLLNETIQLRPELHDLSVIGQILRKI
jgi:hypothetical protein